MQPLFILFDLDGTLVEERSRTLKRGVAETLIALKSQGHFLSVCSNNVLAKEILAALYDIQIFDCIVGRPSTSFKAVEFLQCWDYYRLLYRTKLIRWKIHLNRTIFVDNDEENLQQLTKYLPSITYYPSVAAFRECLPQWRKPPGWTISTCRKDIILEYGVDNAQPPLPNAQVYIETQARKKGRRRTANVRHHYLVNCRVLRRRESFTQETEIECRKNGYTACPVCLYNIQTPLTHSFCVGDNENGGAGARDGSALACGTAGFPQSH
jgi:predicted phosphatase